MGHPPLVRAQAILAGENPTMAPPPGFESLMQRPRWVPVDQRGGSVEGAGSARTAPRWPLGQSA